ncbi:MAG: transcription antitermination factor NusB [Firmicutes bacterium]|nr:transcription antitermination factor NusB [Bacillota bacterium]
MTRSEAREHVMRILYEIEFRPKENIQELAEIYLELVPEEPANLAERDFILREVNGTMEHVAELDEAIAACVHGWSLNRLSKVDLAILRLALYEIRYEEDIPERVSINEAVELAKKYSQEAARGFVNGILANFAKSEGK